MDRFSLEVKVGLVVTAAVGLVLAFIFVLGDWNPFTNTYGITVTLNYAGGVKPGSDVHLAGAKVGRVDTVRFLSATEPSDDSPVLGLELLIDKRAKELIRADSTFAVYMESLLGGKILEITPGSPGSPVLEDGAVVRGVDPPQLESLINDAVALLSGIREIMEGLDLDDKERMKAILESVARIGPEDVDNIRRIIANGADASDELKAVASEVGPQVGPMVTDLSAVLSDAKPLVKKLDEMIGEAKEIMPDNPELAKERVEELLEMAEDLTAIIDRLDRFSARIEQEFGEVGKEEIERIVRQILQQEGITINVGTIVAEPKYPPLPAEKTPPQENNGQ